MLISERHEPLLPFPRLPETVQAGYSTHDLALRPFGLYESDLNVNFNQRRPLLVTHILECCTRDARQEKVEQSLFWNLPVGKRIECLLTLLAAGDDAEIPVTLRCSNGLCGQELEIGISLEEITALQGQAYAAERVVVWLENEELALRRPTGSDQLAWLKTDFADEEAAAQAMLRTLLLEGVGTVNGKTTRHGWLRSIEQAMEEQDPLVDFSISVQCPSCGREDQLEIDLEELALRRLRQAQLRLLASVHSLAAHYHWSEEQIFSVPYWRRAYYLTLIKKEENR